jgi:hypothetical protein
VDNGLACRGHLSGDYADPFSVPKFKDASHVLFPVFIEQLSRCMRVSVVSSLYVLSCKCA